MALYKFKKDDAYNFARFVGCQTKERNGNLHLKYCPYCKGGASVGKDIFTFGIDLKTGKFFCMRASCGVKGNMITLSRDFGFSLGSEVDEYYRPKRKYRNLKTPDKPIEPTAASISYLKKRGISEETAARYSITTMPDRPNILVFPCFDEKERCRQ